MMHEMPGFRKPDALLFGLRTALQRLNATAKEFQSIPSLELQVDFALTPLIPGGSSSDLLVTLAHY